MKLAPALVAHPGQQPGQPCLQLAARPGQQGSKFVPPDPEDAAAAKLGHQQLGHPAEHAISHRMPPAVVDALEVIHVEQQQPVGCRALFQLGTTLGEGPPVHDAGEGIVQQRILPLQKTRPHLIYLAEAVVYEPGLQPAGSPSLGRIPHYAGQRARHQRLLLIEHPHQKVDAAKPDGKQQEQRQCHHQQGFFKVVMKQPWRQIDVEIPVDILQLAAQVAAVPDHRQPLVRAPRLGR